MLVSETGPAEQEPDDAEQEPDDRLLAFAQRVPVDVPSALRWQETAEVTTDGLPLVGRIHGRPLVAACGFGALAAGLAFAASRWVADALVRGTDPTPAALRAARSPAAV
jgi:glycine/D-amino acid oxidase-like deaminating enzyme